MARDGGRPEETRGEGWGLWGAEPGPWDVVDFQRLVHLRLNKGQRLLAQTTWAPGRRGRALLPSRCRMRGQVWAARREVLGKFGNPVGTAPGEAPPKGISGSWLARDA